MSLLPIILTPFVGALVLALIKRRGPIAPAWLAAGFSALSFYFAFKPIGAVFNGAMIDTVYPWAPNLGLNLSLMMDGLAMVFTLIIEAIGLLIIIYGHRYFPQAEARERFYSFFLLFMGSMLGVVLSSNLLLMVLFWELTSISSFFLIGFWHEKDAPRRGAYQALMITALGGLALLGGVIFLGLISGTFEWQSILAQRADLLQNPYIQVILFLILLGAFTKSAQFPFHFWLPDAMEAPTPVSAFLHSATMVKAGVFLLARVHPLFHDLDLWFYGVSTIGLLTMAMGAYLAFKQDDLKSLLAYSTISHLGMMVALLGFGSDLAVLAAIFHILNHAAFKAALFLTVGIVDHETGTRSLKRLGGLYRKLPQTALLASIACLAMAGVPLFNGFLSKELFFEASLHLEHTGLWHSAFPFLAVFASVFTVAYSLRFLLETFFGPYPGRMPKTPHEPPLAMRLPVLILVIPCLLVGLFANILIAPILIPAVEGILEKSYDFHIKIWHGLTTSLLMSVFAIGGGLAIFSWRRSFIKLQEDISPGIRGNEIYQRCITFLLKASENLTNRLQSGSLQNYLTILILFIFLAIYMPFTRILPQVSLVGLTWPPLPILIFTLLFMVATLSLVVFYKKRLTAILLLGFIGALVSAFFARASAPDLALTQLPVEVCSIIVLLLVLRFLPEKDHTPEPRNRLIRDGVISSLAAVGLGLLLWITTHLPWQSISHWHLEKSKLAAGGNNVVNVILVDFRGFDTMGEITVLGLAALGIFSIVRARRQEKKIS